MPQEGQGARLARRPALFSLIASFAVADATPGPRSAGKGEQPWLCGEFPPRLGLPAAAGEEPGLTLGLAHEKGAVRATAPCRMPCPPVPAVRGKCQKPDEGALPVEVEGLREQERDRRPRVSDNKGPVAWCHRARPIVWTALVTPMALAVGLPEAGDLQGILARVRGGRQQPRERDSEAMASAATPASCVPILLPSSALWGCRPVAKCPSVPAPGASHWLAS